MLFVESMTNVIFLLVAIVFINRYITGSILKLTLLSTRTLDETYEPTVTVIVPCFNEGRTIYDTLHSIAAMDYPRDKLDIIVVDDASSAATTDWLQRAERDVPNLTVEYLTENRGKRINIAEAVRRTQSEIVMSVDSDCILDASALRNLLRHFSLPDVAAVGGVVRALNADDNWLTRMQTVKYWIGYEYLKNLEDSFDQVMCLSGCITAYRRGVLLELESVLLGRKFLGMDVKYGEDRFLTRKVVESGYRTRLARDAYCYTKVPANLSGWLNQQLRWRRSNLVDFFGGLGHIHKLKPPIMIHYFSLGALLFIFPFGAAHSVVAGQVAEPLLFQMGVMAIFAVLYERAKRSDPSIPDIAAIWFVPISLMFTVTYLCLSPLALLTLATTSWETRGKSKSMPKPPQNEDPQLGLEATMGRR